MILVTDNAVQHLRTLLAEHPAGDGKGLRVQVAKGGCSGMQYEMSLDRHQPDDAVVEREEVAFFVDPESAVFLRDATLDFEDGLTGAGFRIVNPNAARTCGCGTSFEPVRRLTTAEEARGSRHGTRSFSLRRSARFPAQADELLRLDDPDSLSHRARLRGLARELLCHRATGAAGELPHPEEAAQDRAAKTFCADRGARREFLTPKQLYARYTAMGPAELARKDAELTRNFIRNFQQVHGLVTYVVGRFNIMAARELEPTDVFYPGAVALARAVDQPELLMEHVFTTANEHDAKLLTPRLAMGLDVNFERSHDLSAVIHAERLPDGRIQITAMPLLYGSYAATKGAGTFSLEPPTDLNLAAGWPIFKSDARRTAEVRYDSYREKLAPATGALPIVGLSPAKTAAPTEDALVRVEPAVPLDDEPFTAADPSPSRNRRLDAATPRRAVVAAALTGHDGRRVRPCRERAR